MDYPKHIYILWLIIVFLAGFILLSLGWISYTVYIALFVFSLPVYWLETKLRNASIQRRIAKGKLSIFKFKEWNWERLSYLQFVVLFVVSLPSLFFDLEDVSWTKTLLAFLFIIGLMASKYYRERDETQSIQLDAKRLLVYNYGFSKKLFWKQINAINLDQYQITIDHQKGKALVFRLNAFENPTLLLQKLRAIALNKSLPIHESVSSTEPSSSIAFTKNPIGGLLFIIFTLLNVFFFVGGVA